MNSGDNALAIAVVISDQPYGEREAGERQSHQRDQNELANPSPHFYATLFRGGQPVFAK